jgi:twitching motility two-component system response regulator PilG
MPPIVMLRRKFSKGRKKMQRMEQREQLEQGAEPGPCKLVAIVDASPTIRKIVETSLGREGYRVLSFPDGKTTLRALLMPGICVPKVIFIDLDLPDMDGFTLICLLRKRRAFDQSRLIVLSRRSSLLDWLKMRLSGANAYLTKPVRTQELLAQVEVGGVI